MNVPVSRLNVDILFLKIHVVPLISILVKQDLDNEHVQLDDDLRFILEHDSTRVEELVQNHTNEISETVFGHDLWISELCTKIVSNITTIAYRLLLFLFDS